MRWRLALRAARSSAQQWEMPSDAQRCPSKWGAKDEVGSGNLMKPEMALKAAKLIHTGEVFTLGFPSFGGAAADRFAAIRYAHEAQHGDRSRARAARTKKSSSPSWAKWARSWTPSRTRCTAANITTASPNHDMSFGDGGTTQ